jgi:hypothetical protein
MYTGPHPIVKRTGIHQALAGLGKMVGSRSLNMRLHLPKALEGVGHLVNVRQGRHQPTPGRCWNRSMTRSEFIRRLVLYDISDDYENIDQCILRHVAMDGAKCGLTVARPEVVEALTWLVGKGLARAYILSGKEPYSMELQGMPPLDRVEANFETYFYITKKGIDHLQLSDDGSWPLDDEHNLLPDWHLDDEQS